MARGFGSSPIVKAFNGLAVGLMDVPVIGSFIRRGLTTIRYTGRRSGQPFEIPVGYRRSGGAIVIGVAMPDSKNWWRNFLGEGAPITLLGLDGRDQTGHGVARRDDRGRVSVTVQLDDR